MATEKPRFRNDLVSQPVEEDGVQYVDVTDPESGSVFRFYDVEYSIACAMDGNRDLASLSTWTQTELGIDTSTEELASVVSTLDELGYLQKGPPAVAVPKLGTPKPVSHVLRASPGSDEDMSFDGLMDKPTKRNIPMPPTKKTPRPVPATTPPSPQPVEREVVEMEVGYEGESVDLGDHVSLDKNQVKEAVRASRVIDVPNIPEAIHEVTTTRAKSEPEPSADAIELPSAPPSVRPIEPTRLPQPGGRKGSNTVVIVGAIFLALMGTAAVAWFFVLGDSGGASDQGNVAGTTDDSDTESGNVDLPANDKIPSLPAARLSKSEPVTVDVKVKKSGVVVWVTPEGEQVEIGAVLLKLKGVKRWESKRAAALQRLDHYSAKLKKATASGKSSTIASVRRKVREKEGLIADAEEGMKNLVVKAPVAGVVSVLADLDAKVKTDEPVIRLGGGSSGLVASFDVGDKAVGYKADDPCVVTAKDKAEQRFDCVVTEVEDSTVVVRVSDAQAAEDMEVVLLPSEAENDGKGDSKKSNVESKATQENEKDELRFDEDDIED